MKLEELRLRIRAAIGDSVLLTKSYFAGGSVRDMLLGLTDNDPQDADIAVEAENGGEELARLLHERLGSSAPVVYNSFGTASIVLEGLRLEFVHTRRESYRSLNRKPSVSLGTLSDDALRRDFGINALYMSINDGGILDPSARGLKDLQDRVIRCVDHPERVFREDPLRLLRALRFSVRFGFEIEAATWEGILNNAGWVKHLSWERIASEVNAMLTVPDPDKSVRAIRLLQESGLLAYILPELNDLRGLTQNRYHHLDAFEHSLEVLRHSAADPVARWAALLHDIGKASTLKLKADGTHSFIGHETVSATRALGILRRFKLPKQQRELVSQLIGGHMLFKQSGPEGMAMKDSSLLRIADRFQDALWLLLDLAEADNLAHAREHRNPDQIPGLRRRFAALKTSLPKFSLTGRDLIQEFGISQGIRIGKLLNLAKQAWYEDPGLGREQLLELTRRHLEQQEETN